MAKGPQQIQVLMVSNGTIGQKKVYDFGAFLALQIDKDKWMAWAKGKPLLVRSAFTKRYTYLLTPEIAWTLDGESIVNIMSKAKALAYPTFKGTPNARASTARAELLPPDKPVTEESVNGIIDQRLNNGIRSLIHDEITLALLSGSKKQSEPSLPTAPPSPVGISQQKSEPEQRTPDVPVQPAPQGPPKFLTPVTAQPVPATVVGASPQDKAEELQKELKAALDKLTNLDAKYDQPTEQALPLTSEPAAPSDNSQAPGTT